MQFIDEATIFVKAGDGGNGCVSFRREKFIEKGGPNGGDGGKGGDIILYCTREINTLIDFRYQSNFIAQNGQSGKGKGMHGKSGEDLIISMPVGTQVFFDDGETLCIDLTEENEGFLVAKGGKGGWGNTHFKSSINQAPRKSYSGEPGEEYTFILRLKLLSDVGLLGLPSAGKSTFLSSVTRADAKIGDYPFTTLEPQLGVATIDDYEFVVADLPGLIEGASEGKGLGIRFLKHAERCGVLLHLIDINSEDIVKDYKTIRNELKKYKKELGDKEEIVALTKIDCLQKEDIETKKKLLEKALEKNKKIFTISSVSKEGTTELLRELKEKVIEYKEKIKKEDKKPVLEEE